MSFLFFFFNHTATTEIYTLSLHDALPILRRGCRSRASSRAGRAPSRIRGWSSRDRKSTRLNSSHTVISYAVFCLKKKRKAKPLLDKLAQEARTVEKTPSDTLLS